MKDSKASKINSKLSPFIDFLKTGELGPLNLSLSVEEVYERLGKPNLTYRPFEGTDHDHILTLFYKNLYITFYDHELDHFTIQFYGIHTARGGFPPQLNMNWFYTVKKWTFEDFLEFVKANKLLCQLLKSEFDEPEFKELRFPDSGVVVWFNLYRFDSIYEIHRYQERNANPDRQFEVII